MPITIVLADEHEIVRAGIVELLRPKPELRVVGECSRVTELFELVETFKPVVTIVGIPLQGFQNEEYSEEIRQLSLKTRVILFGDCEADSSCAEAQIARTGAAAFLSRKGSVSDLTETISRVAMGNEVVRSLSATSSSLTSSQRSFSPMQRLSRREEQILQLVASGKSSKEIAAHLRIGETTVKTHREHIMDKLGTRSIAGLTRKAIRLNLVSAD